MDSYLLRIKIKDEELEEVIQKLEQAKKTVYECYEKLYAMGRLELEKTASDN